MYDTIHRSIDLITEVHDKFRMLELYQSILNIS